MPSAATFVPGDVIDGSWEVVRPLGRGGMGSVVACRNVSAPSIRAALKLLDRAFQDHAIARDRFLREAEILHGLDHPGVVRFRNIVLDKPAYIEMELVEGIPLNTERVNRGPLAPELVVHRAHQLLSALAYLHRRRVYHRDVKPENILVQADGSLKLVDFGLAVQEGGRAITQQGRTRFGTVSYCPPEWIGATPVDPKAWDAYAAGLVLYEMVTGEVAYPLPSELPQEKQILVVMMEKQEVEGLDAGDAVPRGLRDLLFALTARQPENRLTDLRKAVKAVEELLPSVG